MKCNLIHRYKKLVQAIYPYFKDGKEFTPRDIALILGGRAQNYGATCRALHDAGVLYEVPFEKIRQEAGKNKVGKRYYFRPDFLRRWSAMQPRIREVLA